MGIRSFVRRRKGLLLTIATIAVLGYIGVNLLAYSLTYKPEACLTCHIMKPYYDNWKASSHNKVGCIDCHPYRPSTIVQSSLRYLTGSYRLPLRSTVDDKECILCHKPESTKVVNFRGTPFNHKEHQNKEKRGKNLHCTSCHYSLVQSRSHMDVDTRVCVLCHFYTTPPQYNQNCIVCHGEERKDVKIGEVTFSHQSFLKTGARCIECHSQTVIGSGETPEEKCRECHIEPQSASRDTARLHAIHISKKNITCFKCHTTIEHGKETIHFSKAIDLSCNECHNSTHRGPRDMYMGIGSQSVKDAPSAMYVSRVRCTGCHTLEKNVQGKQLLSKSWESKKKSCVLCHKPGYDKMAEDMKKGMAAFTEGLTKLVDQYGKVVEERKGPASVSEAYRAIRADLQFLQEGRGEHNVKYAFDIGKAMAAKVQEGYKALGITQKLPIPEQLSKADGYCGFCHATFQPDKEMLITAQHLKFNHRQHVEMGMECTKCHDPRLHRLGNNLLTKACKECHEDMKL